MKWWAWANYGCCGITEAWRESLSTRKYRTILQLSTRTGRRTFPKRRLTSRVFITGRDSCYKFAMAPDSRAEIELAQTLTHYPVGGELLARTRYGDECFGRRSDMAPCHDCGVTKAQLHIPCCEVEECPNCHTQLVSCDCDFDDACSAD